MERTNLWPRPLDEKNLTTDWIEETFGDSGWMPTPYCKNRTYQYLTYIGEALVGVSWRFGENQLTFVVIPDIKGSEEYLAEKAKKAIEEIKQKIAAFERNENYYSEEDGRDKLYTQYNETNDRIDFFFYWDSKD